MRILLSLSLFLLACTAMVHIQVPAPKSSPKPPLTQKESTTVTLHGHKIADPYQWLENDLDPRTAQFVADQNAYTRSVLDVLPTRHMLRSQFKKLFSHTYVSTPSSRKDYYFYTKRESNQDQEIVYMRRGLNGTDLALVDPNALSKKSPTALDWLYPSPNGTYITYGLSTNGSENSTLYVKKNDGTPLADVITRTRHCKVAWKHDESGFYYTRCPKPGSVQAGEENYHRKVYYHALGTDPDNDQMIYYNSDRPLAHPSISLSKNDRWLLISASEGDAANAVRLIDCTKPNSKPKRITPSRNALYSCNIVDDDLYIYTNEGAPNYRLFKTSITTLARSSWQEIIPESGHILNGISITKRMIIGHISVDVTSRLRIYTRSGKIIDEIPLPSLGDVTSLDIDDNETSVLIGFETFTEPKTIYHYDLYTKKISVSPFSTSNPNNIVVKQVFYPSKDGTTIPMFICHKKDITLDGTAPTLLTGYGGFSISLTPGYDESVLNWVQNGGIFAQANIRGGDEYGEAWHQAATRSNKQNSFDDFICAAEYLFKNKYTNSQKLAIRGRSNGGLLVAAVMTQRPDLCKAVVCEVPLTDMLRFHSFLMGRMWISEYGCAENANDFKTLYAYSPYHKIKPGTSYPATLILTADSDTRVHPMHARKMAARLQDATSDPNAPILMHTERNAGHGAGTPVSKTIDEYVDIFSFLAWQLGVEVTE